MKGRSLRGKLSAVVATLLAIIVLASCVAFGTATNTYAENNRAETVVSVQSEETREGSGSSSIFDGIINLIAGKGMDLLKSNLPTIGDFLGRKIFDFLGIDYADSVTLELREVNEHLKTIESGLSEILDKLDKTESQTVMQSFINNVDTFSYTVAPVYEGYNDVMRAELEGGKYEDDAEGALNNENEFYNKFLKPLIFGSSTSTGGLYQQLMTLANMIVQPSSTSKLTLMEHYEKVYRYLWAFDMQSFGPKTEFLGYVGTNLVQGVLLYAFQNRCAVRETDGNTAAQAVYDAQWLNVYNAAGKAFNYLAEAITELNSQIDERDKNNTTLHYATNTVVSRELFTGRYMTLGAGGTHIPDASNHFQYLSATYTSSQHASRDYENFALNARDFGETIRQEFAEYKTNNHKDGSFTLSDYLREIGFTCNNWSNAGLYEGQSYKHKGIRITNEHSYLYTEYVDQSGNKQNLCYAQVDWKVLGSPKEKFNAGCDNLYMAFVDANGTLIGSYEAIDYGSGTLADNVKICVRSYYDYNEMTGKLGKVR